MRNLFHGVGRYKAETRYLKGYFCKSSVRFSTQMSDGEHLSRSTLPFAPRSSRV